MSAIDESALRRLYLDENRSIPDIAEAVGASRSTVRRWLLRSGVSLRSRPDGVRAAAHKISERHRGKQRLFTEQWKANIKDSAIRRGEASACGVSHKASGYIEVTIGVDKGRYVHVLRMEKRLGRRLLPDEEVHHIDGNKSNNDDDNLALVTKSGHARLHRLEGKLAGIEQGRESNGRFR
jgi:hypothetical protein